MKKKIVKMAAALTICAVLASGNEFQVVAEGNAQCAFGDVKTGDYYEDAVLWALQEGITGGVSETQFGVGEICTRAQIATFLWRLNGCPEIAENGDFYEDLSEDTYYYDAANWAKQSEIMIGKSEKNFSPNDVVTRAEVITYIYQMAGSPSVVTKKQIQDVAEDDSCYEAVLWAAEEEIVKGISSEQLIFDPNTECSREQAIVFLWRAFSEEYQIEHGFDENTMLINAADYGLSVQNTGVRNSRILQKLVEKVSEQNSGATIYIPEGEYVFEEIGQQTIGSHCIKMHSNVNIKGAGEKTILKPTGVSEKGLDMFYYNEYVDTGKPIYLENCNFEDFVIDGSGTSCKKYTSAGKGFMFNLFKNCNWKNVTVKNTDATGFGVDCPIGGSIMDCTAIHCGKAATTKSAGASGFGIGFGYSEEEYFTISNCKSYQNKKFGFFFEHQGRFSTRKYGAKSAEGFLIKDCEAVGSYYNYGGLLAMDTTYENCTSEGAVQHGFFFENSKNCTVMNCTSSREGNTCFVILQSGTDGGNQEVTNINYQNCRGSDSPYGIKIRSYNSSAKMEENSIQGCEFTEIQDQVVFTSGKMLGLKLENNISDNEEISLNAVVDDFVNIGNSWND